MIRDKFWDKRGILSHTFGWRVPSQWHQSPGRKVAWVCTLAPQPASGALLLLGVPCPILNWVYMVFWPLDSF